MVREPLTPEAIAAGIRKVLDVIAKKQPQAKVLLLPIFPFGSSPQDAKRVNNEKANAIIKGFADGKSVIWVDFGEKFLDEKGDNVKWMPDHCHPNDSGAPFMGKVYAAAVGRILGSTAK